MRRGTRRGQSIADSLRIVIRDDPVASPESSPDSPDSPGSPDSVASTPSPTSTTFNSTTAKADSPPTTQTVPPPPATTSKSSSLALPPPAPTTTTSIPLPPPATTNTSPSAPPTTTSRSSASTKTASPFFNHPELSTTGTLVRTTVISSSAPRTTTAADSSPQPILLNPAVSTVDGTGFATATRSPTFYSSNALTSSVDAEREVSMSTSATAEAVTAPTGGLGFEEHHERLHLDAGSVAGIAIGSSVATMLIAAMVFFFWRKWNRQQRRDDAGSESGASTGSGVRRMLTRRFTHKSDDRIMNELMAGVYSNESGGGDRNSFMDRQMQDGNGYIREKFGSGGSSKAEVEEDELPIMAQPPKAAAVPGKPQFKRTKRISRWLGRHDEDDDMMNPNSARASLASNATGLRTIDLRSMSGWGGSEYGEYFSRDSMPPLPMGAIPPREDPEVEKRKPLSSEMDDEREEQSQNVQGQDVRVRDSTPVTKFPSAEELKLPPPPGRPMSVAARTEVTGRSSGTWNTWGVMQHRDQPKGWKERLGM
ncbi:hypothetical protein PFICI_14514 [Pestalotiopsis fici W106-1]|uniref:Uncharacterized protein n=1 Tax=Pestalotiopsis fici (strain W106-1 / CGMCC3.15140) TaxID=1229662 RepID=W3WI52_PESFW|nr:uncharacterized protein PFICI_14514 [Pestalotiopsis fici W106-1]ETS73568.1 hypothetical protein PFICI_14514 [Pestalotiopsis fici W106-1]